MLTPSGGGGGGRPDFQAGAGGINGFGPVSLAAAYLLDLLDFSCFVDEAVDS